LQHLVYIRMWEPPLVKSEWEMASSHSDLTTGGHNAAGRIMSMKNSSDTIGNRTSDLPACSAVPQPTATTRAPTQSTYIIINTPLHNLMLKPTSIDSAYS
jgi:hypothetical protein